MKTKTNKAKKETSVKAQASKAEFSVNALSSKAINTRLSTSAFIGNPRDKALTAEVEDSHNTEAKRISVRKKIMQGKELNAVAASLQQVRKLFESLSAPWLDGGIRIVSAAKFIPMKVALEKAIREFYEKVDAFIDAYDSIILRDKAALNGTFNIADYPSKEVLRGKFKATIEALPIPTDFRVEGIDDATREEMQRQVNELTAQRVTEAKRELLERLASKTRHLKDRLNTTSDKERFHTSAVTNVTEACEEVLNCLFDGDETITKLVEQVKQSVADLKPDDIRDKEEAKTKAKEKANEALQNIEETMKGFLI